MIVEKNGVILNIHPSKIETFINDGWRVVTESTETKEVVNDGDI